MNVDEVISGAKKILFGGLEKMENKLNELIEKIDTEYRDGKIDVTDKQWQHIVLLVGGIAKNNASWIEKESEAIKQCGKVEGSLNELLILADKFAKHDFA